MTWSPLGLILTHHLHRQIQRHTHTHWGTTAIQRSFSHCAFISGRLLSLTHCCAERGFSDLTWLGFENTSEPEGDNEEAAGAGATQHLLSNNRNLCVFWMSVYFPFKMFSGFNCLLFGQITFLMTCCNLFFLTNFHTLSQLFPAMFKTRQIRIFKVTVHFICSPVVVTSRREWGMKSD